MCFPFSAARSSLRKVFDSSVENQFAHCRCNFQQLFNCLHGCVMSLHSKHGFSEDADLFFE